MVLCAFRLHRPGDNSTALTVTLGVSGTAALNSDYTLTATGGTVSFSANTATVTLSAGYSDVYLTLTNETATRDRTVMVTLLTQSSYTVNPDHSSVFAVLNNDGLIVTNTNDAGAGSLRADRNDGHVGIEPGQSASGRRR